jgi:hypothetical protein
VAVESHPDGDEDDRAPHRGDAEANRLLQARQEEGPAVHLHEPEDGQAGGDEEGERGADVGEPLGGRHALEADDGGQHVGERRGQGVERHERGESSSRSAFYMLHLAVFPL